MVLFAGQKIVEPALYKSKREMFFFMIALLVIVVPIILQNPSDLVYPVAENDLQ
jgi:phosphatidylglycerophosphate synthase